MGIVDKKTHKKVEKYLLRQILKDMEREKFFLEWKKDQMRIWGEKIVEINKQLCDLGWYIPNHFDITNETINEFYTNTPEQKSLYVKEFINKNIDTIFEKIYSDNPKRKEILEQAFEAHKNQKYALSVPVLLSQADGIFYERIGANFFRSNSKNALKKKMEKLPMYVQHFFDKSSINQSTPDGSQVNFLNRHSVLHGADTLYHNLDYSLKSISFLSSVNYFVDPNNIVTDFDEQKFLMKWLNEWETDDDV